MEQQTVKKGRKKLQFTEEQLKEAGRLAGLGFSEKSICEVVLGCSVSTLQRNKKRSDNFDHYIREGKLKSIEEVSSALFDSATGKNGRDPSVSAQIFFLKNKGKQADNIWADVQQIETSVNLDSVLLEAKGRLIEGQARDVTPKQITKADNSTHKEVNPQVYSQRSHKNTQKEENLSDNLSSSSDKMKDRLEGGEQVVNSPTTPPLLDA